MKLETDYTKDTVQSFSSYQLSTDEFTGVSYGLDCHIPARLNNSRIHTKFEQFYSFQRHTRHTIRTYQKTIYHL